MGQRLEPLRHLVELRGVEQQHGGANGRELADQRRSGFAGDGVIGGDAGLGIGRAELRCLPQLRQLTIARCALARELAERVLGFGMLAFVGEFEGGFVDRAGFGRLAGLPVLVATPGGDGGDDEEGRGDDEVAVALPQLLELFSPYFLVDFVKDIGHRTSPPNGAWPSPNRVRLIR